MTSAWLYPIIFVAGALQAWGPPMNGALRVALTNPWLASLVSFLPVVAFLIVVLVCLPSPVPSAQALSGMPWWAPLGGLIGAFAVVAGLLFVDRVGAGAFAALTLTANILMSMAIDHFGLLHMQVHRMNSGRAIGSLLLVGGIVLVSRY